MKSPGLMGSGRVIIFIDTVIGCSSPAANRAVINTWKNKVTDTVVGPKGRSSYCTLALQSMILKVSCA